jgi:peptide-methionine (S)-S-oxide reductase
VSEKVLSEFQKTIENKIVTGILPLINFYKAENYHQNYYNLNSQAPYCMFVIDKKIEKLRKDFGLK